MGEGGGQVAGVEGGSQIGEACGELAGGQTGGLDRDQRGKGWVRAGGVGCVVGGPELLCFLVPGPGVGEFDGDVAAGGQLVGDEVGQVSDEVGGGKNGREQGGWLCQCGGEEQVDGLVEGEEVAAGGGIGDGDGAAAGDLVGEDFCDAVAGGQDVAEAQDGSAGGEDDVLG